MAVWKNAFLSLSGTDVSSFVRALSLSQGVNANNDTAMGDDTESSASGLKTWGVSVEFNQSSTSVDAVIDPLLGNSTGVAVVVRRSSTGSAAASNPEWSGTGIITDYQAHGGNVGDHDVATLEITSAGSLTRATTT